MKKVTDNQLSTFIRLGQRIVFMKAEQKKIREALIANGTLSTKNFVASVQTIRGERLAGKAAFIKAFGKPTLVRRELLKKTVRKEINVRRKEK